MHGLLHLLGFDHAEPDEKAEMFGLKDKIIAALGRPQRPDTGSDRIPMNQTDWLQLAIALVLVFFAGLTAAAEAALSSFSRARADRLVERGASRARAGCARSSTTRRAT